MEIFKDLSPIVRDFYLCGKNKHIDKQTNKLTFDTKEKEKRTETETILKFLVGPIPFPIHFQGKTKKNKIKDKS